MLLNNFIYQPPSTLWLKIELNYLSKALIKSPSRVGLKRLTMRGICKKKTFRLPPNQTPRKQALSP